MGATIKYLLCDVIGACSCIEYGKAGDRVEMVDRDNYVALVDGSNGLFHVRLEKLSDQPLVITDPVPEKPEPKPITELFHRTGQPVKDLKQSKVVNDKQSKLF